MGQTYSHHIADFRKDLTKYIDQVKAIGVAVLIKKYEKPFAVLVPVDAAMPSLVNTIECSVTKVRPKISELLHQVHYNDLQVIITVHKKPIAVLRPLVEGEEL